MSIRRSCAFCAVRARALCCKLPKEQLSRLNRIAYQRRYNGGQFIMGAGQRQDWFATVLSGVVKLTRTMCDGRQQIVGLQFPSDLLGRPFSDASPSSVHQNALPDLLRIDPHRHRAAAGSFADRTCCFAQPPS